MALKKVCDDRETWSSWDTSVGATIVAVFSLVQSALGIVLSVLGIIYLHLLKQDRHFYLDHELVPILLYVFAGGNAVFMLGSCLLLAGIRHEERWLVIGWLVTALLLTCAHLGALLATLLFRLWDPFLLALPPGLAALDVLFAAVVCLHLRRMPATSYDTI